MSHRTVNNSASGKYPSERLNGSPAEETDAP